MLPTIINLLWLLYIQQPSGLISALWVYTCEISAILLHNWSTGISYPYLYLKFAASYIALCTCDLLSAVI